MARPVAHRGSARTIVYAVRTDGTSPGAEFVASLDLRDQAKLHVLFQKLADTGQISNKEKFKKIEGTEGFFEFKSFQIRMPCYFVAGGLVVITHGFRKKSDRIPPSEIERAKQIRSEDELGARL